MEESNAYYYWKGEVGKTMFIEEEIEETLARANDEVLTSDRLKNQYHFISIIAGGSLVKPIIADIRENGIVSNVSSSISFSINSYSAISMEFYDKLFEKIHSINGSNYFSYSKKRNFYPTDWNYYLCVNERILSQVSLSSHKLLENLIFLVNSNDEGNKVLAVELLPGYFDMIKDTI